jgi:hypothetical protein
MDCAQKSGRPYVGVCHAGIVLACVSVTYEKRLGGIFSNICRAKPTVAASEFAADLRDFVFRRNHLDRARKLDVVGSVRLSGADIAVATGSIPCRKRFLIYKNEARQLAEKARGNSLLWPSRG